MTTEPRMSLIASFDDLCRHTAMLTEGQEEAFLKFVRNQEECRQKWLSVELELEHLQALYKKALAEKAALESSLAHARNAIELEMNRRMTVEQERNILEHQIHVVRELLCNDFNGLNDQTREKLAFLSTTTLPQHSSPRRLRTINESSSSVLSSEDISYDRTDENIDVGFARMRRLDRTSGSGFDGIAEDHFVDGKRRTTGASKKDVTPPKKIRIEDAAAGDSLVATTTVEMNRAGPVTTTAVIESRTKMTQSLTDTSSVLHCNEPSTIIKRTPAKSDSESTMQYCREILQTPSKNWTPIRHFSSSSKLNGRGHSFCDKTIIRPELCGPCGKRIKFGKAALKCRDCRAVCHPECRETVPLPCVPVASNTPTAKGVMGTIADYTPMVLPMIPGLVIHCIKEVEARGLTELGIYRVPGADRDVKVLKERFLRGKGVPNLSTIDIHCVCGCLKDFLRSLKEPLITNSLWKEFVAAAENSDIQDSLTQTYQAITQLPQPNRDTLAYLILHLQRVSESPECRMPASSLAKIFGPTIVGYSSLDHEPAIMLAETTKQAAVMERLMSIASEYWEFLLNVDNENVLSSYITPNNDGRHGKKGSSGRRTSSLNRAKGYMTQTPLGPRENIRKKSKRPVNFFNSPLLK